jgi:hypothetical protein
LERNQIDALFLVNSVFGFLLTLLCLAAAPYIAEFYHYPELTKIVMACGGVLFLSAMAVQPNALLRRQMKLKEISVSAVWSLFIAAAIAIILAKLGFGYWALVAQLIAQQLVNTVLSFTMSGYHPKFPLHFLNMGTLLSFGGYSSAYGMLIYISRNLDNVLIGKMCGAVALGYYSRAYFLMTLPGMLVIGGFSVTQGSRADGIGVLARHSTDHRVGLFTRCWPGNNSDRSYRFCIWTQMAGNGANLVVVIGGEHPAARAKHGSVAMYRCGARTRYVPHGPPHCGVG